MIKHHWSRVHGLQAAVCKTHFLKVITQQPFKIRTAPDTLKGKRLSHFSHSVTLGNQIFSKHVKIETSQLSQNSTNNK